MLRVLRFALLSVLLIGALEGCALSPALVALRAGVEAAEEGRWEEAVTYWRRAAELDPGSAAAYNNLAVALERSGDLDAAGRAYEQARRLDPLDPDIKANQERWRARRKAADRGSLSARSREGRG